MRDGFPVNLLFYSPQMAGHPQVYCRVLADIFAEEGHSVVIAGAGAAAEWPRKWPDLVPLIANPRVRFVNVTSRSATGRDELTAEEMRTLQEDFRIDSTLWIDANPWAGELRRIAEKQAPRLRGRTAGIFARTSGWYPRENDYGGAPVPLFSGGPRASLARLKNLAWPGRDSQAHLFRTVLLRQRALDVVVVKDERVSERFGPPVHWMPEIFKVFNAPGAERNGSDWDALAGPIRQYIQRAGSDNVLLFFGTGAWYKGYDLFLRLAELDPSTFALHAGAPARHEPERPMAADTEMMRARLLRQGRLFETNAFVESPSLVRLVFDGIARFVSTHRLTLSSGTMLQALDAGKPVLTPATGNVGYRTRKHGLGLTYRFGDEEDIRAQWLRFRTLPPEGFKPAIRAYMEQFSREAVAKTFRALLLGEGRAP